MSCHHVCNNSAWSVLRSLRKRNFAVIVDLTVEKGGELSLCVAFAVLCKKSVRDYIFVELFVLILVDVVVGRTLKTESVAVGDILRAERSVCYNSGSLLSPYIVAVTCDNVFTERNESDRRAVFKELVKVYLCLELDLENVGINSGDSEVVNCSVAHLNVSCVLYIKEKRGCFACWIGIKESLPSVNVIGSLNSTTVAPLVAVKCNENRELFACILFDLVALHAGALPFAVFVNGSETFINESENLELRVIGDAQLRVEIIYLCREIHINDCALIVFFALRVGRVFFKCRTSGYNRYHHQHSKDKG